jgi:hypothetical protein
MDWLKKQWRENISELEKQNDTMTNGRFRVFHSAITVDGIVQVDDTAAVLSRNTRCIAEYTSMLEAQY